MVKQKRKADAPLTDPTELDLEDQLSGEPDDVLATLPAQMKALEERYKKLEALPDPLAQFMRSVSTALIRLADGVKADVDGVRGEIQALTAAVNTVIAIHELQPETLVRLNDVATRKHMTLTQTLDWILGQVLTDDPNAFIYLFQGDMARYIHELAAGRGQLSAEVVDKAVRFAYDNRTL